MKIKYSIIILIITILLLSCSKQKDPEIPNYTPSNYIVKTIETPADNPPPEDTYQTASHLPKEKKSSTSQEIKQPINTTISTNQTTNITNTTTPTINITQNTTQTNITNTTITNTTNTTINNSTINNTIINNTITNTTITNTTNTTLTNTTTNTTQTNTTKNNYSWHLNAYTTQFYVGTPGTTGAGAWDINWLQHYGGVDNPINRTGYYPLGFTPKENPFYYALPYSDFDSNGKRRTNAMQITWYVPVDQSTSLVKNRWIEVKHNR